MTAVALLAFPAIVFVALYLRGRSRRQSPPARVLDSASLVQNIRRGRP